MAFDYTGLLLLAAVCPMLSAAPKLRWEDVQKLPAPAAGKRVAYGAGPFPVVVLIHGGCWRASINLDNIAFLADALTAEGYATWSIEYRRVGDESGGWPGTFDDVLAGLDYVGKLGAPLDLGRVVVAGHSAGGQLALWAGAKRREKVRGVVSLSGVVDLRGAAETVCVGMIPRLVGGEENYVKTSPKEMLPLGVRQWIVTADGDEIVPAKWGAEYVARAMGKGDTVELVPVEDAGHFELIVPSAAAYAQVREAIRAAISSR